jgi:gluconate kinase
VITAIRPRDELPNVLWVGGVAGAGKTTVARRIARRYGLRRYNPDTQTWNHLARALAKGNPAAQKFADMTPTERAAAIPNEIHYDREPMVIDDLRSLPTNPLTLAELIPPERVATSIGQAVFLMPSQEVQRSRLERRHPQGVPPRYLRSWQETTEKVAQTGTHVIVVDDLSVEETVAEVERIFASRLAQGPTAQSIEERRDLLRYGNLALADQCLGWSRYTPGGDVSGTVLEFDCECAAPTCTALVKLRLTDALRAVTSTHPSILASEHSV